MCVDCGDRGVKELDMVKLRLDAMPQDKKFTHLEMLSFFESLGNPYTRSFTLCNCRGKTCWWLGMADGCRPIPDYPERNAKRALARRLAIKHRRSLELLKEYETDGRRRATDRADDRDPTAVPGDGERQGDLSKRLFQAGLSLDHAVRGPD